MTIGNRVLWVFLLPLACSRAGEDERSLRDLERRVATLERKLVLVFADADSATVGKQPPARIIEQASLQASRERRFVRDKFGRFLISGQELAYHSAVTAALDRQRRIEAQLRNHWKRIEMLISRTEIAAIPTAKRPEIEAVLLRYATSNDDLVTAYVRTPGEEVRRLTTEDVRDQMHAGRVEIRTQATTELRRVLGAADGAKVGAAVFRGLWGRTRR